MGSPQLPEALRNPKHANLGTEDLDNAIEGSDPFIDDDDELDTGLDDELKVDETDTEQETDEKDETDETEKKEDETDEKETIQDKADEQKEETETETDETDETETEKTHEEKVAAFKEKYKNNPDKLAEAAIYMQRMQTKQGLELGETRKEKTQLEEVIEGQKQLIEHLTGKKDETKTETPETGETDEDIQAHLLAGDYEKATNIIENRVEQRLLKKQDARDIEKAVEQGQEYNAKLVDKRATELLLELATELGDADSVVRYSAPDYVPTEEENAIVAKRINAEMDFIQKHMQFDEKTFRYPANVFQMAQFGLNGSAMLKSSERQGKETAISQMQKTGDTATVLTPRADSKVRDKISLEKVRTASQARKAAKHLTDEELDAAIEASEPEY